MFGSAGPRSVRPMALAACILLGAALAFGPSPAGWDRAFAQAAPAAPVTPKAEVIQAYEDFQKGRMGQIPAVHGLSNDVVEG